MSSLKNIVVFVGPPGSGKGTLSKVFVEKNGWEQLSTGDLCRKHIAEGTQIGQEIDFAIKSGKLVSDSLISRMVDEWLAGDGHSSTAAILDGYPRTVAQAKFLHKIMQRLASQLSLKVVLFDIADETVVDRLSNRYICERKECQAIYSMAKGSFRIPKKPMKCDVCGGALIRRKDDDEHAVRDRLQTYHKHEQALFDFYRQIGQEVIKIDADQPLNQVFAQTMEKLGVEFA